jgi:hypothetical protein
MAYAIKAAIAEPVEGELVFHAQKTMYGGKKIGVGDVIYLFASENDGGRGLVARGIVTEAAPLPRLPGVVRQTPLVSIAVRTTALATRSLGRNELRRMQDWGDGRPETELNFKLYRQATNKIVAISDRVAEFLETLFPE